MDTKLQIERERELRVYGSPWILRLTPMMQPQTVLCVEQRKQIKKSKEKWSHYVTLNFVLQTFECFVNFQSTLEVKIG